MGHKEHKHQTRRAVGCNCWYNNPSASPLNVTNESLPQDVIHLLSFNTTRGDDEEGIQTCREITGIEVINIIFFRMNPMIITVFPSTQCDALTLAQANSPKAKDSLACYHK